MVKVDIVSGFLGAGKTTLIKKLLSEALAGEKIVLLENEYGEVGIDGGFMKNSGIQVSELNAGCICCTIAGDFANAIDEIIEKYAPERLIIEPSGVGKLSEIRHTISDTKHAKDIKLMGGATVVDALKCKMYLRNFGEFYGDQIKAAETIVLSRTQHASAEKLHQCVELIKEVNPDARIITTPWAELTGDSMLSVIENPEKLIDIDEVCPHCGHHHEHHHEHEHHHHEHDADEVFTSLGYETVKAFDAHELERILNALSGEEYGSVLRAKGIVRGANGWLEFDFVPGEIELREGSPDYTGRLCVIGSNLNEAEIKRLFGI